MSCKAFTKKLIQCKNKANEGSFFCSKHKENLYEIKDFHLIHSGNIEKILEENIIKTSKETKNGTLWKIESKNKFKKREFSKVFFQLIFPKIFTLDKYEAYKGDSIEVKLSLINKLIKQENFQAHFSTGFSFGLCHESYCVKYDTSKSLKENLNYFYNFWVLDRLKDFKDYKWKAIESLDFEGTYFNEFVIEGSVPLVIDGKSYIKRIF